MPDRSAPIELLPQPDHVYHVPPQEEVQIPWYRATRFRIFITVFLVASIAGLSYTFMRPAVYQASASLLAVAPRLAGEEFTEAEVDSQHIAIQQQILSEPTLLEETLTRLATSDDLPASSPANVTELQSLLSVVPIESTHLLELRAEGSNPEILPLVINTWLDTYLDVRAEKTAELEATTNRILRDEVKLLGQKVANKRDELAQFREQYDILSSERSQNEALARLDGLNASLNTASEEEAMAKAELDAMREAVARGELVVPDDNKRELANLEARAQELRERLIDLRKRYTPGYIALEPTLKVIPKQLQKLEEEIRARRDYGKTIVLSDAQQAYASARRATANIRQQLNEHKAAVKAFTTRFAEYESLQEELLSLEERYRETQERLVQVELKQQEKYPQFDVIRRATVPRVPVRPLYLRDAGLALIGALLLGLVAVVIAEFLTRIPRSGAPTPASVTLSGIHMYADRSDQKLSQAPFNPLFQQTDSALQAPPSAWPRELSGTEVDVLLEAAGPKSKQVIAALLSGITLEEAAELSEEQFNVKQATVSITGTHPRQIPLAPFLHKALTATRPIPAWRTKEPIGTDELSALITCAAIDSGLSHPEQIDNQALRQTYLIYLVRQGLRLSDLEQLAGAISPTTLTFLARFSPPERGLSMDSIDPVYPALT